MFKKSLCILLAALLICCACACAKRSEGGAEPTATPTAAPTAQPGDDGPTNVTTPSKDDAFAALDPAAVLIRFKGAVEADVTAEQLKELSVFDYTETQGDDTPVFTGVLVKDLMELIGAADAQKLTITMGGGAAELDFAMDNMDLDTAMFAFIKNGAPIKDGGSMLICKTLDGFGYTQNIDEPVVGG